MIRAFTFCCFSLSFCVASATRAKTFEVSEDDQKITIVTPQLEAVIRKKGYVSGVAAGTLKDLKTGFRESGFGLDIVDSIDEMHEVYDAHEGFSGLEVSEKSWKLIH